MARSSKKSRNSELKKQPPKILYKYVIGDRTDILIKQCIRFTQPALLNDPFEVRPAFLDWRNKREIGSMLDDEMDKSLKEEFRKIPALMENIGLQDVILNLAKDTAGKIKGDFCDLMRSFGPVVGSGLEKATDKISILSLTEDRNNLLMWSHYANQHMGFVIGFDASHEFINHKLYDDEFRHPRPVLYTRRRPKMDFSNIVGSSDDLFAQFFLTKSMEWSYEKEWRVTDASSNANTIIKLDSGDEVNLFSAPHDSIREVIIGARSTDDVKHLICAILATTNSLHHVKLYKAIISSENFDLDFYEIRFLDGPKQTAIDLNYDPSRAEFNEATEKYAIAFKEKIGIFPVK